MKAPFILATFSTVVLACFPFPAIAQQLPPLPIQFNPDRLVNPGRPGGRRRGGGSRGDCPSSSPSSPSLTAIAYARTVSELGIERTDETAGAFTTQAQPTLWFYLPSALSSTTATSFAIKDSRDQLLYEGQLSGDTPSDGIISVPVPIDLTMGTPYHWFLTISCGAGEDSDQATVDGWIERQAGDANFNRVIGQADSRNRAALYANYGFLQDATTELAALRLANREDAFLAQDWVDFLAALDLRDLTAAPLLECCGLVDARSPQPETKPSAPEVSEPEVSEPEGESVEPEPAEPEPDTRTILQRARDRG